MFAYIAVLLKYVRIDGKAKDRHLPFGRIFFGRPVSAVPLRNGIIFES